MAKKKANQKHIISVEELVSLPLIPGIRMSTGNPKSDRIYNLIGHACSVVLNSRKNRLSKRQKVILKIAFKRESSCVLALVGKMSQLFEGASHQDHINFFVDYKRWCKRLEKYVNKSLDNNTASLSKFLDLYYSQADLLVEAGLLADITRKTMNEAIREGMAILEKELQETANASADNKADPPENDRKKKQKKRKIVKDRFSFAPGQVLFDGTDLKLPTGLSVEVLKKLIQNFGATVGYGDLDENMSKGSADEKLRTAKKTIKDCLKITHVPCQIVTKAREGYCLCEISPSKKPHKRATRKSQ